MLNNAQKKECGFADEIVAYIYDEIGQPERTKFESHLVNCTACTDEFAGIANARFSVFEYRKEEFAHLSTPEIIIPYEHKSREVETAGFFAGLRDMLTLSGWSAATVAGAVILCIGLGFVAMNYVGVDQQIASNKATVNTPIVPPVVTTKPQNEVVIQGDPVVAPALTKTTNNNNIRPVRAAVVNQHRVIQRNLTADTQPQVQPLTQKNQKAPVLSYTDDDDDKSLRLSDLVDDGGV